MITGSLSQIVRENEDQTHPTITDSPVLSSSDCENQEEVLGGKFIFQLQK